MKLIIQEDLLLLNQNGNVDDDGWPLGEQYNGALSNLYVWATATNYVATGGAGYLYLDNNNQNDIKQLFI